MYPVTQEFNTKIRAREREVFGKVQIDYTDPLLDQSIEAIVNEQANVSYLKHVHDGINSPVDKILSLDGSCSLDGTYRLAPTEEESYLNQMGWWGEQLSNTEGLFIEPYPTLRVNFASRAIHSLKAVGDSAREEHPVDFTINLYNKSQELLYAAEITGNTSNNWSMQITPVNQVTSMEIVIYKWSHPGRQAKIVEFFTSLQETYEDDKGLISMSLLEEMEIDSGGLAYGNVSSNELTVQLDNSSRKFHAGNTDSPLYNMLKPNRRIKAWLGVEVKDVNTIIKEYCFYGTQPVEFERPAIVKEYVPLGVFWSGDWDAPEDGVIVKTIGKDRIEFLKQINYSTNGVLANVNLYNLTVGVFANAGLEPDDYIIDEMLKEIVIPYVKYEDEMSTTVLRHISQACLGNIYCDREGIIRVEGPKEQIADVYNVSANEQANISYPEQVTNTVFESTHNYASLDGFWELDGTYALAPEAGEFEMGWWGSQLSDSNGNFAEPYPTLILGFISKAISRVQVVGDSNREEYPVDFDVMVYDSVGTVLSHQIITGNANSLITEVQIPENPTNATKIDLVIKKWSHPGRQAKIVEFNDIPYKLGVTPEDYFVKNNPSRYSDITNVVGIVIKSKNSSWDDVGEIRIEIKDENSIVENGRKGYEFPANPLIQTENLGYKIINKVLNNQKLSNRNLTLDWRGNPALMLGNEVTVVDTLEKNNYRVVRQTIDYDGALRSNLDARRVVE